MCHRSLDSGNCTAPKAEEMEYECIYRLPVWPFVGAPVQTWRLVFELASGRYLHVA